MRLITRSDFDGLACAVLLQERGIVDSHRFVHPKDLQDGRVAVGDSDILANVPYVPGCGMWFDHHCSERERLDLERLEYRGVSQKAPSAAQLIWDYYGGESAFRAELQPLIAAVNKCDSGDLSREEILHPAGWILLSFVMDARTGLGRFGDFRIGNYRLMEDMIDYCKTKTAEEIAKIGDVQERIIRYFEQQQLFIDMIRRNSTVDGNVVVTILKDEETIFVGNRFVVYALYPQQNIDVRVMWGRNRENVVFACGRSILNRTSQTNIGKLMLRYGGGGHPMAGTCQVPSERWKVALQEVVSAIKKDG